MRIILKIFAAPFVFVLTILCAVLRFLFCTAVVVLHIISVIIALIAIVGFFMGMARQMIFPLIFAFLISPFGIPAIARWLIEKLSDLNENLIDFIKT